MRRRWPLTLRGNGALILAVACFPLAGELGTVALLYVGCLLFALIVVSTVALRIGLRVDGAERTTAPDVVALGATTLVRAHVTMRGIRPAGRTQWSDGLPHGLASEARGDIPAVHSMTRGGKAAVALEYPATATRRGVWSVGPLSVRTSDPFGIARWTRVIPGEARVTVVPAAIALPRVPISGGDAGGNRHSAADVLGQGSDNPIPRPYASGDSMRRIHWRATAHRDELMVRQEEQESSPTASVMLDRSAIRWDASAHHEPGADARFETALSTCVSIVLRLARDGYRVRVRDIDGAEICDPIGGVDAPVDSEAMLVGFASMLTRTGDSIQALPLLFNGERTGPLVLITGRLDIADATALAPVAHHSGLPVLLSLSPAPGALAAAEAAGWHTAALAPRADLRAVWLAVAERGGNRVFV